MFQAQVVQAVLKVFQEHRAYKVQVVPADPQLVAQVVLLEVLAVLVRVVRVAHKALVVHKEIKVILVQVVLPA